jgi:hypothetical protein
MRARGMCFLYFRARPHTGKGEHRGIYKPKYDEEGTKEVTRACARDLYHCPHTVNHWRICGGVMFEGFSSIPIQKVFSESSFNIKNG